VAAAASSLLIAAGAPAEAATIYKDAVVGRDGFSGTVRPLGAAEVGGTWQAQAPAGTTLSAGAGQLAVPTLPLGGSYSALLPSATAGDVTVRHGVKLPSVGAARLGLYESTELRRQSDGDRYAATLIVGAGGALDLRLTRTIDGHDVVLNRSALGVRASSGAWLTVETQVAGTSPVTVQARVYPAGQPAPAWQVVAQDASSSAVKARGSVGLDGYLSASGVRTALAINDFSATERVALAEPAPAPAPVAPVAPVVTTPGLPVLQQVTTNGFNHPGVLNGAASLAAVRANAAAGKEPWKSAMAAMKSSRYAKSTWTPHPVAWVGCGAHNSPDEGCTAEMDDAQAAYANAMVWYFTGDRAAAEKAKQILNSWSGTLVGHKFDTTTYVNGRLQAAWAAETFTKAAELVRYSGAGWAPADVTRFEGTLKTAFLPLVRNGWTGGGANWLLSMADATTAIGVFTNDRGVFDDGVGDWRNSLRSAIYLSSDGPVPALPVGTVITTSKLSTYWNAPTRYVDGLEGETCRDASHMAMGLGAALSTAETASLQGLDLYGEQRQRLVTGMEYNARFINNPSAAGWACSRPLTLGGTGYKLTWEVGYHHYAGQQGALLPETKKLLGGLRPTGSVLFLNWETLTHGTAL